MGDWPLYTDFPINPSSQIRVLELRPGCGNEPITTHLRVHDPQESGYEALSYTWGGSSCGESITLNHHSGISVTGNLFNALRRLRRPKTSRTLWIDAVCINQANLNEQSQQVQLMRTIYRKAARVLVWLGDANEPEEVLRSPFQPPQEAIFQNSKNVTRPSNVMDRIMRSFNTAIFSSAPRWWTRTWIIQEVVLAQNPIVCFGEFEMTWSEVGDMREDMSVLLETTRSNSSNQDTSLSEYIEQYRATDFDDAYEVLETLREYNDTWAGLSDLARTTAHSQATDSRDRVYGFFGLWSGADSGVMKVDYEKSISEVFAEATFADICVERNLEVLNLVRPQEVYRRDLPTWALDFTFQNCDGYLPVYPDPVRLRQTKFLSGKVSLSENSKYLTLDAVIVDRIETVYPLPRSSLYPSSGEEHYLDQIVQCVPNVDPYAALRERFSVGQSAGQDQQYEVGHQSLPADITPTQYLGLETDPISDVFLQWLDRVSHAVPSPGDFSEIYGWWKIYARYQFNAKNMSSPSSFYRSKHGFIGKALATIRPGDLMAYFRGMGLPAIIRPVGKYYQFLGLTWLNGGMMGELNDILESTSDTSEHWKQITLT